MWIGYLPLVLLFILTPALKYAKTHDQRDLLSFLFWLLIMVWLLLPSKFRITHKLLSQAMYLLCGVFILWPYEVGSGWYLVKVTLYICAWFTSEWLVKRLENKLVPSTQLPR